MRGCVWGVLAPPPLNSHKGLQSLLNYKSNKQIFFYIYIAMGKYW